MNDHKETIAFTPIYNVIPSEDIIDKDFNGYKILKTQTFWDRYSTHIERFIQTGNWLIEPNVRHIQAEYFLVADSMRNLDDANQTIDTMSSELVKYGFLITMLYLRLHKTGNIQMGTFFISYKQYDKTPYRDVNHTDFLCLTPFVQYGQYKQVCEPYMINNLEISDMLLRINNLEEKYTSKFPEILEASRFFTRYYETSDLIYKITNLITVLEKLLINDGKDGEIQFKLKSRLTFLHKDNSIKAFITKIYEIRSKALHQGEIPKDYKIEDIFEYIIRLEEICRKTINYFLNVFIKNDETKILTVNNKLNEDMFYWLSKNDNI